MYIQFTNEIVSGSLTSLLLNVISGFNNEMLFIYYCEKNMIKLILTFFFCDFF